MAPKQIEIPWLDHPMVRRPEDPSSAWDAAKKAMHQVRPTGVLVRPVFPVVRAGQFLDVSFAYAVAPLDPPAVLVTWHGLDPQPWAIVATGSLEVMDTEDVLNLLLERGFTLDAACELTGQEVQMPKNEPIKPFLDIT